MLTDRTLAVTEGSLYRAVKEGIKGYPEIIPRKRGELPAESFSDLTDVFTNKLRYVSSLVTTNTDQKSAGLPPECTADRHPLLCLVVVESRRLARVYRGLRR